MQKGPNTPSPEYASHENGRLIKEMKERLSNDQAFVEYTRIFLEISEEQIKGFANPSNEMVSIIIGRIVNDLDFARKLKEYLEFCKSTEHFSPQDTTPTRSNVRKVLRNSSISKDESSTEGVLERTRKELEERIAFVESILQQGYSFSGSHFYQIRTKILEEADKPQYQFVYSFLRISGIEIKKPEKASRRVSPRQVMQYLHRTGQKKRSLLSLQKIRSMSEKAKISCEPIASLEELEDPDEPIFVQSSDGYCLLLDQKHWKMYYDPQTL